MCARKKASKKKVIKIILISLAVFVVLNLLGAAIGTSTSITHPSRTSYQDEIDYLVENGLWGDFSSYDKVDYMVSGLDGYQLHCARVSTPDTVGTGKYVIISHGNGMYTLYAHLAKPTVSSGQSVTVGQQIGVIGSTGHSTGPHLHFEVRIGGNSTSNRVDPEAYLF